LAKKYLIETFGCQMNFHDSERMAGLLEQAGYEPTDESREADLVVINTCSVRERAEDKLYSRLGELRADALFFGRRPVLAVTGCVAQQEGKALRKRSKDIDVIVGTQSLKMLPMLVQQAETQSFNRLAVDIDPHEDVSFPLGIARRADPVKAYVNIVEGCNDFCAFCVVPYTRGHERMRPVREILAEVTEAADSGRREVQLLGQIVNHYQAPDDPECDFPELLSRVAGTEGVERIRFASPHPRHVGPRLIQAIRDIPQVCKHLHLPVQSGSSRVLKEMRRRYTRESYLELVAQVREAVPDIALSTDMIVGFPGETAEDFAQTLSLVEQVRFHSMFSFKYSPRPNTLAGKRLPDDVPEPEKSRRLGALQQLQKDIQMEFHQAAVGREFDVLVDSTSRKREWELSGRTTGNTVVNFPVPLSACEAGRENLSMHSSGEPDWIGRTLRVRITEAGPNSLRGTAGPHAD
jgi:tRNA-2-methylthio-N6-dimethylallyladenosine synthase